MQEKRISAKRLALELKGANGKSLPMVLKKYMNLKYRYENGYF